MPAEKELLVRVLDVPSLTWSVLQPSSAAPPARGGHSVRPTAPPRPISAFALLCCRLLNTGRSGRLGIFAPDFILGRQCCCVVDGSDHACTQPLVKMNLLDQDRRCD